MGRDRRPPDDYPPQPPDDYPGPEDYPTEPVGRTRQYPQMRGRPPEPPPRRTSPWVWVAILGLVLAAGVIVAILLIRNDDDSGSSSGSTVTVTTGSTSTVTTQPQLVSVPDVGGETQISAVGTIQDAQLVPNTYPVRGEQQRGVVVAQSPSAGSDAQEGSGIRLNVSTGTSDTGTTTVPGVIGSDGNDARLTLTRGKLCVRTLTRTASSPGDVGNVVAQSPSSGSNVAQYAQVTIYVGT